VDKLEKFTAFCLWALIMGSCISMSISVDKIATAIIEKKCIVQVENFNYDAKLGNGAKLIIIREEEY